MITIKKSIFISLMIMTTMCYAHGDHDHDHEEETSFHWNEEKAAAAHILAQTAGPGMLQHLVQVPGKITFHPDHLILVIPKISGMVQAVYKNLGDSVVAGEVIALIESEEIASAKGAYLLAEKKLQLHQQNLQREAKLRRLSAHKDYLEAQLAAEEAQIHAEVALQHLYALGFKQEDILNLHQEKKEESRFYQVRAPLSGKIVARNLQIGERLEATSQLFQIANFDQVGVELHVSPQEAYYLKEHLPLEVMAAKEKMAHATLSHFNPTICEETRKMTAFAVLDNKNEVWKPGEFITATIQTEQIPVSIIVPKEAVQTIAGENCIFVEDGKTGFCPCAVKLGKMDRKNVEIISGLQPGVKYAATNTFTLKADYEKNEGEHH